MNRNLFLSCLLLICQLFGFCNFLSAQDSILSCHDLKNLQFYSYPKNTADRYYSIRSGNLQTEINMVNGDTSLWQVSWLNDCTYALKLISLAKSEPQDVLKVLNKHKLVCKVGRITDDYYVFTVHIDKPSNPAYASDTVWLHEKLLVESNEVFKVVPDESTIAREHFSDSSGYALVYIYRPGKFTNSLSNFLVYMDDDPFFVAKNNGGRIFKFLKQGTYAFRSQAFKENSTIKVDVRFGKRYYVKSMIHWGVYDRLYNFKLEMALMPEDKGAVEFGNVKLNK